MTVLQNSSNNGGTWQEYGVKHSQVIDKKIIINEGSETLWDYTTDLLDRCVEKGILSKD